MNRNYISLNSKVIKVGDLIYTNISTLYIPQLSDINISKGVIPTIQASHRLDEIEYKSIVRDINWSFSNCPIILKYLGKGRFEEMETGTVIISDGTNHIDNLIFEDINNETFKTNKNYESIDDLSKDLSYVLNNTIIIKFFLKIELKTMDELTDNDKIIYQNVLNGQRKLLLNYIENISSVELYESIEKYEKQLKNNANYDHNIALLDNKIYDFRRKK